MSTSILIAPAAKNNSSDSNRLSLFPCSIEIDTRCNAAAFLKPVKLPSSSSSSSSSADDAKDGDENDDKAVEVAAKSSDDNDEEVKEAEAEVEVVEEKEEDSKEEVLLAAQLRGRQLIGREVKLA
jgi:hypothetical protein